MFIPAYNAADTLTGVLKRIPEQVWPRIEAIIVIDDGSADPTAEVVASLGDSYLKLELFSSPSNQGYGATVKKGLKLSLETGAEYIACLHADGQYPPEELGHSLEHMQKHGIDVLQGSRHKDGKALAGGMPYYKYVAGKVLIRIGNLVFGLDMTDYHSGFLFYSREAVAEIPFEKLSTYFDFDLEFIACARRRGMKIAELAIPTHYGDEKSYLNPVLYGLHTLYVMGKYMIGRYNPKKC